MLKHKDGTDLYQSVLVENSDINCALFSSKTKVVTWLCIRRMLPLREKDTILQSDACALTSTFTGVRDVHKADRVQANEFSGNTIATDSFTVHRTIFNESHDRPGCVSWHELVTVNLCRVPPLLSSHTCTHRIPKNSRVSPNIHDEGNHSLINRQV